ncbi:MAG: GNAT family N-acetyltransferase [Chloroflexi bacterium]|nr:GNAT family N-acetyltransferase [Chloroflexota bacterium]
MDSEVPPGGGAPAFAPAPAPAAAPASAPASAPAPAPASAPTSAPASAPAPAIEELDAPGYEAAIPALAALLVDAVEGGASVNFIAGVTAEETAAWWAERLPQVADGTITVLVARDRHTGALVGSSILIRSRNPNAPHRAEVGKVIVHRSVRRQGLGRALMAAIEARARADGRWLLILDTTVGTAADALYRSLGWQVLGTMPNHAYTAAGVLSDTTYFWKDLRDTTEPDEA